jgi:hypothetical protein
MKRRNFIGALSFTGVATLFKPNRLLASAQIEKNANAAMNERTYWYKLLHQIASPVISNLAMGTLVKNMPLERPTNHDNRPINVAYLEAVGRTLAGIAPWLALADDETIEGKLRKQLRKGAIVGLNKCFAPNSPDKLLFEENYQPIVDAAYMAHAFLRAPVALWEPLEATTKKQVIASFQTLRNRKPFDSNWLLFGSITEAFLLQVGEKVDEARLHRGIAKLNDWYKGDGWYGDGPNLPFDYYNSFVIHPMMVDTLAILVKHGLAKKEQYDLALKRMQRYAVGLERMISPEGTFPPIGRSITYRTGAFQALSQLALMKQLPNTINPAQVRAALTKVKQNMYETKGTFNKDGWLQLGFCGHDPMIADYYTNTGSLYMATLSFLPLGLPASDPFWTAPAADWTAKQAWAAKPFVKDYHVDY